MNERMKAQLWHSATQINANIIYLSLITNSSQTYQRGRACPPDQGMLLPNPKMVLPRQGPGLPRISLPPSQNIWLTTTLTSLMVHPRRIALLIPDPK